MGFVTQKDLSLFRNDIRSKARKPYLISISSNGKGNVGSVEGYLTEGFSFDLDAEWGDLLGNIIPGSELLAKTGDSSFTTGVFSQKYFAGGGHISLPVKFRVLDEEGTGNVIRDAKFLSSFMVSPAINLEGSISEFVSKAEEAYELGKETVGKALDGDFAGAATHALGGLVKKAVGHASARGVHVKIGNFFNCKGMYIKSLKVEYSKELGYNGPLYGDFDLTVESMQALTRGGSSDNHYYGVNGVFPNSTAKPKITLED